MDAYQFSIQKKIFEIRSFSKDNVHELQNRISQLATNRLTRLANDYFTKIVPAHLVMRIDELVLELGEVAYPSMEAEIEERFIAALDNAFIAKLALVSHAADIGSTGINTSVLTTGSEKLLEYFLLHGTLPWWAPARHDFNIDDLLDELLRDQPGAINDILLRAGKNQELIKRLVNHFSEQRLEKIIRIAVPSAAGYIMEYLGLVTKTQQEQKIIQSEETVFRKSLWLFIFKSLFVEKESVFSEKMFLKSNLLQFAAYYNLHYTDLLQVLYVPLELPGKPAGHILLLTLIEELFTEESAGIRETEKAKLTVTKNQKEATVMLANIELIEYYLRFGTIPSGFEQLTAPELRAILFSLAHLFPVALKNMILSPGKLTDYHSRFLQLAGPVATAELIALIFPGAENRPGQIARVFESLQDTYGVVQTSWENFVTVLWEFIFEAMVITGTGRVDETFIIQYIVKGLERKFSSQPHEVWTRLDGVLQKSLPAALTGNSMTGIVKENVSLFKAVTKKDKAGVIILPDMEELFNRQNISSPQEEFSSAALKDVLRFLLQYGSIPWWGRDFYVYSITAMVEELFLTDRVSLLVLFRQSGLYPNMRKRLFENLPGSIFIQLIKELSLGNTALEQINRFSTLFYNTSLAQYYDKEFINQTIYTSAFEAMLQEGYIFFPGIVFFINTILQLGRVLKMDAYAITLAMKDANGYNNNDVQGMDSRIMIETAAQYFGDTEKKSGYIDGKEELIDAASTSRQSEIMGFDPFSWPEGIEPFIRQYFNIGELSIQQLQADILEVLQYFITWNRLPDRFNSLDQNGHRYFIRQILLFSFQANRGELLHLFSNPQSNLSAFAQLDETISASAGGNEKQLKLFMHEHIAIRLKALDTKPGLGSHGKIENNPVVDTSLLIGEDPADEESDQTGLERAAGIISYYLQYSRLPGDMGVPDQYKTDQLLKRQIVLLFSDDPGKLRSLLDARSVQHAPALHLYDLFVSGTDIVTSGIAAMLDRDREDIIIRYLAGTGKMNDNIEEGKLDIVINYFLQKQRLTDIDENMLRLFSSSSFGRIIQDRYGMDLFIKLLIHKQHLEGKALDIIKALPAFLDTTFRDHIAGRKLVEIFKRFNINFISGQFSIRNERNYIRNFLEFIAEDAGDLAIPVYKTLIDRIEKTGAVEESKAGRIIQLIMPELPRLLIRAEEKLKSIAIIKDKEDADLSAALRENADHYRKRKLIEMQEATKVGEKKDKDAGEIPLEENETGKNSIYINNAGLVLFHPYITTYLERVGLLEKNEFVNEFARDRAVLLLQYLVTGIAGCKEYELVLNKIFCGADIPVAISTQFVPTALEEEVTGELFTVFKDRWPQISNTSVDGIRSSFIQRNGVLRRTDEGWTLRVEQKAYDILLQTLPWAFGFIKLPMMDKAILVEWI